MADGPKSYGQGAVLSEKEINQSKTLRQLPDVAEVSAPIQVCALEWVGMEEMELPVLDHDPERGLIQVPARVAAFVSLDQKDQRGIHMSRLYTLLRDRLAAQALDFSSLQALVEDMISSQQQISESARLELKFEKWRKRQALKSGEWGWRRYPFKVLLEKTPLGFRFKLSFEILYSSTCPASAALARHDLVESLNREFGEGQWSGPQVSEWLDDSHQPVATPHAQRSRATIDLTVGEGSLVSDWGEFIDRAEEALGTPVQTAVRREDEQEFARLNGQNLLFCEDAARRLLFAFREDRRLSSFQVRVEHQESLHPHNAVATASWPPAN